MAKKREAKKIPRPSAGTVTILPTPVDLAAKLYIELYTSESPERRRELYQLIVDADDGETLVLEQIRTGMLRVREDVE